MIEPRAHNGPVRPISWIDALGCGGSEALFDGNGNHLAGLFPNLDAGTAGSYITSRPASMVLGDIERQPIGLFWMMLPVVTEAGLGAVMAPLDRGEAVALFADRTEILDEVCRWVLPMRGGANA